MLAAAKANALRASSTPDEWGAALVLDQDDYWRGRFRGRTAKSSGTVATLSG